MSTDSGSSTKKGVGTKEQQDKLYAYIKGCGEVDKYIDAGEQEEIYEMAATLDIWKGQAEAMLNHLCRASGWTREADLTFYMKVMLKEATKDDGVIDKKEFDHILGFAVLSRMPRKDAIRICCSIVRQEGWKTANEGFLKKNDWLANYENG